MDFWFLMVAACLLTSNCVSSGVTDKEWKKLEAKLVALGYPRFIWIPENEPEKGELELALEGIESLDRSLDMYNNDLEKLISSSVLKKLHEKLNKYLFAYQQISKEGRLLLIRTKRNLWNGAEAYFRATDSISQWCESAIFYLHTYKDLLNEAISTDQIEFKESKIILLALFDARIEGLTSCERELSVSSSSFNTAFEALSKLKRFNDISDEAKKHYEDLSVNVENVTKKINEAKRKLKEDIENISFLKIKTEIGNKKSTITPARKEKLLKSVDLLIAKCTEYQARHQQIN